MEEPKKPGWLEELSRKQAHRKSGLFNKEQSKENLKETGSLPATADKPQLPVKPSQIRDDGNCGGPADILGPVE